MNTPAVTIVAAWMSAETGVGPSIASGSQVWSRNCADLPMAPMKSSRQATVIGIDNCIPETGVNGLVLAIPGAAAKIVSKVDGLEQRKNQKNAECEAEIANAVDDERLHRGCIGGEGFACTRTRSADRKRDPRLPNRKTSEQGCPLVTSISIAKVKRDR